MERRKSRSKRGEDEMSIVRSQEKPLGTAVKLPVQLPSEPAKRTAAEGITSETDKSMQRKVEWEGKMETTRMQEEETGERGGEHGRNEGGRGKQAGRKGRDKDATAGKTGTATTTDTTAIRIGGIKTLQREGQRTTREEGGKEEGREAAG